MLWTSGSLCNSSHAASLVSMRCFVHRVRNCSLANTGLISWKPKRSAVTQRHLQDDLVAHLLYRSPWCLCQEWASQLQKEMFWHLHLMFCNHLNGKRVENGTIPSTLHSLPRDGFQWKSMGLSDLVWKPLNLFSLYFKNLHLFSFYWGCCTG